MKKELIVIRNLIFLSLAALLSLYYLFRDDSASYPAFDIFYTLIILSGLITFVVRRYKKAALIYPGLWFSATWIFAIICYIFLQIFGLVHVQNDFLLRRLLLYIEITALFFFIMVFVFRRPNIKYSVNLSQGYIGSQAILSLLSVIVFIGALINWIGIGFPLGYSDSIRQQWLESIPKITAITWYPYHLIFPSVFFVGWKLKDLFFKENIVNRKYYMSCFLLVLAALLWSIGTGGRQLIGFVMLYFLIGLLFRFALDKDNSAKLKVAKRKVIYVFSFIFIMFALFATFTNQIRASQQNSIADSPFVGVPVLESFGFFVAYMGGTIMTSQAYGMPVQRDLSQTGPVSFNGLLDFGTDPISLYYILGLRRNTAEDTNPERSLASSGQELAYGTRNIYYDLEADFGYPEVIVVIFILVLISHIIFDVAVKNLDKKSLFKFSFLVFILMYWLYSQQLSLMMSTQFKWTLSSFLIWTLFYNFVPVKKY